MEADYRPTQADIPLIPKFGMRMRLTSDFDKVEYYGRGPWENYPDRKLGYDIGHYTMPLADFQVDYVRPQDNGNHGGTKYLRLFDEQGCGVEIIGVPKFSFSVHEYTQSLLCEAKHREDLHTQNTTFLSIDGFMRGSGSNACGPDALDKYRFTFKDELKFRFAMKPIEGETE